MNAPHPPVILLAEDNDDHFLLTKEAFAEARLPYQLHRVNNGEELMSYLLNSHSPPLLILLDLNMPKKDGREALNEIKAYPTLQRIPIIILTTSKNEEDVLYAEKLGAASFVRKPVNFAEFVQFMKMLTKYIEAMT